MQIVENRPREETIRAKWNRKHARAAVLIIAACGLALYFLVLGHALAALAVGLIAILLGVGLILLMLGSRVKLTDAQLLLRAGFIPYSFPWSDIRGFVVDRCSPSDIYVAALHPQQRKLMLFEIPPVKMPSALLSRPG